METEGPQPVQVGDYVHIVNETYEHRDALVTCVHGSFDKGMIPCINVIYVSADPAKSDPYGRQLERLSSLQHFSMGPRSMPKPGRYWTNA